jgi:uncharacterized protein YcbK (DUF882 family)
MKAILVLILLASTASAEEAPKKLRPKQSQPVATPAKWDKELTARLGKPAEGVVNVFNTHTHETLVLPARADATVDGGTMNKFLRDHFTNHPTNMEPRLAKVLVGAAMHFKSLRIDIVSGYRSPKFNLILRKKGHEVARDSQHTRGTAVDFRVKGVTTRQLLAYVKSLRLGGAGFYPNSAFVHADTGPIRFWLGDWRRIEG